MKVRANLLPKSNSRLFRSHAYLLFVYLVNFGGRIPPRKGKLYFSEHDYCIIIVQIAE
jgi:hypothetical protein